MSCILIGSIFPSTYLGTCIKQEDVNFLHSNFLCKYAFKWREIGTALGFLSAEQDIIAHSPGMDTLQHRMESVLTQWAHWPTDSHPNTPTLEMLCGALRSNLVGLGDVANELCEKKFFLPSIKEL